MRVFQLDELVPFVEKYSIKYFDDVTRFLKKSPEYKDFTFCSTEDSITAYHLVIDAGIARIKECISINKAFRVTLSFEGFPVPLPEYIDRATGSKLTHLYLLENLPNYCRNVTSNFDIQVIQELLNICYISPRGRPKYTANILKFALLLRYTSNSAYQLLNKYIPLPSQSLLRSLKSPSIDSCKALSTLRDNDLIGNDIVLLLDEMYLQPQVNFERKTLIGCDQDLDLFKSILSFMVISLTKSISFIVSAIPIVKISGDIVRRGLTLPSSSLNYYVESAFCALEASETEIVQTAFPWKTVSLRLLQEISQTWDSAFACISHTPQVRKTVNRIIANIYYNNLRKCINESIRKDQVAAFKSVKRQKVTQ